MFDPPHSPPPMLPASYTKRMARPPTLADILAPLGYALSTAALGGGAAWVFVLWLDWSFWPGVPIFFTIVLCIAWGVYSVGWTRHLYTIEEYMVHEDLFREMLLAMTPVPPPPPSLAEPRAPIEVTMHQADGSKQIHLLDLDIDEQRQAELAKLALADRLSEVDLQGVVSRREWHKIRDRLLEKGYMTWKNEQEPRQGVLLTKEGHQIFAQVVEHEQGMRLVRNRK